MKKIILIATREFVSTVTSHAFVIGLLILPLMVAVGVLAGPRLFNLRNFKVVGDLAIVDPTGRVTPQLRAALDPKNIALRRENEARAVLDRAPESLRQLAETTRDSGGVQTALGMIPDIQLIDLPATADIQQQKDWLNTTPEQTGRKHLALVVIHTDAVEPAAGTSKYGSYDLYVPPSLDDRADSEIQQSLRDAIVSARIEARALDKDAIEGIIRVGRVRSVTITK